MRTLCLILALLVVFPAYAADWRERPGAGDTVDSLSQSGRKRVASARPVNGDLTTAPLSLMNCATAVVCVTPDITNNDTFDKTAEVVQCPLGSTTHTAAGCKTRWIFDSSAAATKDLDGNEEAGTDCIFGLVGPVLFVTWAAIASGTTQVDAICEQASD